MVVFHKKKKKRGMEMESKKVELINILFIKEVDDGRMVEVTQIALHRNRIWKNGWFIAFLSGP